MYRHRHRFPTSSHRRRGLVLAAALAAFLLAGAAPASAQCTINAGVAGVAVELMAPPIHSSSSKERLQRREHARVSEALAEELGITGRFDSDPFDPNPQVRVIIESPSTIDGEISFANFTVTGTFPGTDLRIRIHEQDSAGDENSGEYKLFADDTVTGGVATFPVDPTSNTLVGVEARVLATPVSRSDLTGVVSPGEHYCEPDGIDTYFLETAEIASNHLVVLAPHGRNIEVKTSDQLQVIDDYLDARSIQPSLWDVRGAWVSGTGQTYRRLHVTSTALSPLSFPGLQALFDEPDFEQSRDIPFRYAVSLHGYSDDLNGVILGGDAHKEAKCLIVKRIQDEAVSARGSDDDLAFRVHDPAGDLTVADSAGGVPPDAHSGTSNDNVVNRLSPNSSSVAGHGGIQIEMSDDLRNEETNPGDLATEEDGYLRNVVARGIAQALKELVEYDDGEGPSGFCSSL